MSAVVSGVDCSQRSDRLASLFGKRLASCCRDLCSPRTWESYGPWLMAVCGALFLGGGVTSFYSAASASLPLWNSVNLIAHLVLGAVAGGAFLLLSVIFYFIVAFAGSACSQQETGVDGEMKTRGSLGGWSRKDTMLVGLALVGVSAFVSSVFLAKPVASTLFPILVHADRGVFGMMSLPFLYVMLLVYLSYETRFSEKIGG